MKYSKNVKEWITSRENSNGYRSKLKAFKKYHPDWLEDMLCYEKECNIEIESFQELICCYMNEYVHEDVYCKNNNKKRFRGISYGYSELCKEYRKCEACKILHNNRIQNTFKERYGTKSGFNNKSIKEKVKNTNLEKYGCENAQQNDEIRNKTKITNLERYGSSYYLGSVNCVEKSKESCLKKYGVNHYSKTDEYVSRTKNTNIERYGTDSYAKTEEFKKRYEQTCLEKYGVKNYLLSKEFKEKFDGRTTSNFEQEVYDYVVSIYNEKVLKNEGGILNRKELDIYIPDKNLAIECNGIYWHSEKFKSRSYHNKKYNECKNLGIQLLQIYEDDWLLKTDIVKGIIKAKLGITEKIYARKCIIKEITPKEAADFLNKNHLQGNINAKIKIALYYNNEILSVLTFGNRRSFMNGMNNINEYELYRFATKIGYTVVGGFSKMLKYFIQIYNPSKIITYASCDISNGNVYKTNKFVQINKESIGYWWVVNGIKQNRFNFTKQKLIKKGFDKELTEAEIMHSLGYNRIYDSGNLKFELIL